MSELIDWLGSAVLRAAWQGAALAIVVALVARVLGDRLAPRWKYLLWSVVLARLILIAIPSSPWSVFRLAPWDARVASPTESASDTVAWHAPNRDGSSVRGASFADSRPAPAATDEHEMSRGATTLPNGEPRAAAPTTSVGAVPNSDLKMSSPAAALVESAPTRDNRNSASAGSRWIAACGLGLWLVGAAMSLMQLGCSSLALRRKLRACRVVRDTRWVDLLDSLRLQLRLRRTPALFVTPDAFSPCVVGLWSPRIVVPEALLGAESPDRVRHVLAHELAHIARGDLWTNWLLLAARITQWFNPAAWLAIREAQAEREAACDDLAQVSQSTLDRAAYATTLIDLAEQFAPSSLVPGFVGFYASNWRLRARIERLVAPARRHAAPTPVAAALIALAALTGLTDAAPRQLASAPSTVSPAAESRGAASPATTISTVSTDAPAASNTPQAATYTLSGKSVHNDSGQPRGDVEVRLYQIKGRAAAPREIARTKSDAAGKFAFEGLEPPRLEDPFEPIRYGVYGFHEGRPASVTFLRLPNGKEEIELAVTNRFGSLRGRVVDAQRRPVAGANVCPYFVFDRPALSLGGATTDAEGRFALEHVPAATWPDGKPVATQLTVTHPDFPQQTLSVRELTSDLVITFERAAVARGRVVTTPEGQEAADEQAWRAAPGTIVTARRLDEYGEHTTVADATGNFRFVLPEGKYDFLADAPERVSVASAGKECIAGQTLELPWFKLLTGGWIVGRVLDAKSKQPITTTEAGEPIMLGLLGPSQPAGRAIRPQRLAAVDSEGRFTLRAAPGENFPYFVNYRGDRMAWNTSRQPAVIVRNGERTAYDMLVTHEPSPEERRAAARKLLDSFDEETIPRTERILREFRKLSGTIDNTELWCLLTCELVQLREGAVPPLCAELDRTKDDFTLRRLAFALRAKGDQLAIPALIRALPRTLLPSSSTYGLIVADPDLTRFMQMFDLDPKEGGAYFTIDRPGREVIAALQSLSQQMLDGDDIFEIALSPDPRRQVLQRRLVLQQAERWQQWWEANWRKFTQDDAYRAVNLPKIDEPLPPKPNPEALGPQAKIHHDWAQAVVSPLDEASPHAWHFYDLDSHRRTRRPAHLPATSSGTDRQRLDEWMRQEGYDLHCVVERDKQGRPVYALRGVGLKVWEISPRDARNLAESIPGGKLPVGRPVAELLIHFDPETGTLVPDSNGVFLFVTNEGNIGLIETTDRVTRNVDLAGSAGSPPPGGGFHRGVRFNLSSLVP